MVYIYNGVSFRQLWERYPKQIAKWKKKTSYKTHISFSSFHAKLCNYLCVYLFDQSTHLQPGQRYHNYSESYWTQKGVPTPLKILIHILFKNLSCELLLLIWMCHIPQKQKIELWQREKSGVMLIKMVGVQMIFTILFVMFCII